MAKRKNQEAADLRNAIEIAYVAATHYLDKSKDPGHGPGSDCPICACHLEDEPATAERAARIAAGPDDGQRAQQLLERVRETQTAFWNALRALEDEIGGGLELDGTRDYQDVDLDDLTEEL